MEPLDWSALRENCAGDESLVNEVLELFRTEAGGLLGDVSKAVTAGDAPAVKRAAHRIKGALVSLGARPSTEAARVLEVLGAGGDLSGAPLLMAQLETEVSRLMAAIALPRAA